MLNCNEVIKYTHNVPVEKARHIPNAKEYVNKCH